MGPKVKQGLIFCLGNFKYFSKVSMAKIRDLLYNYNAKQNWIFFTPNSGTFLIGKKVSFQTIWYSILFRSKLSSRFSVVAQAATFYFIKKEGEYVGTF